jgi:hypothetical protein
MDHICHSFPRAQPLWPLTEHVPPCARSCLVAADGTVLSPDLQPVPPGFVLSSCKQQLLRPNGKPVPGGVHVGPGFRLLKPTGELMPDGEKLVVSCVMKFPIALQLTASAHLTASVDATSLCKSLGPHRLPLCHNQHHHLTDFLCTSIFFYVHVCGCRCEDWSLWQHHLP